MVKVKSTFSERHPIQEVNGADVEIIEEVTPPSSEFVPAGSQLQVSSQRELVPSRGMRDALLYSRIWRSHSIRRYNLQRITNIIWLGTTLLEQLLAARLVLKLIGANPAAGFAAFIYNLSGVFLWPFFGLTETPSARGIVLETSTVIAMIAYAILAWAIVRGLWVVFEEPVIQ